MGREQAHVHVAAGAVLRRRKPAAMLGSAVAPLQELCTFMQQYVPVMGIALMFLAPCCRPWWTSSAAAAGSIRP
jgi:hypothetical protein